MTNWLPVLCSLLLAISTFGSREGGGSFVKLNKDPAIGGLRPAVDPMMVSVSETFGAKNGWSDSDRHGS